MLQFDNYGEEPKQTKLKNKHEFSPEETMFMDFMSEMIGCDNKFMNQFLMTKENNAHLQTMKDKEIEESKIMKDKEIEESKIRLSIIDKEIEKDKQHRLTISKEIELAKLKLKLCFSKNNSKNC